MPEYLSPAVYVEEVNAGIKPIEGVSTSTAGFVGVTLKGPSDGLPLLVTSFPEFRRIFGGYLDSSWGDSRFFAYAVQAFFDNGGQRLYVKRVPGSGAAASTIPIPDGIITRLAEDLKVGSGSARLISTRGISHGSSVKLTHIVNGVKSSESVTVNTYNNDTGAITLSAAPTHSYSRADTAVEIRQASSSLLKVEALDKGAWGDDLRVRFDYTTPARSDMVSSVVIPVSALSFNLTFNNNGPANGAKTTALSDASSLKDGDTVEFIQGAVREQRQVTVSTNNLNWDQSLVNDFSGTGSSIRVVTAIRAGDKTVNILAAMASSLSNTDQVQIDGGGNQEQLKIASVGASSVIFTLGPGHTYLEGATLTVTSSAAKAGATSVRVRSARNFYPGALVELDNTSNREYFKVNSIAGNDLHLSGATANTYQIGNQVRLCEFKMQLRYLNTAESIDQLESFDGLSMNPQVSAKYVVNVVNGSSQFVKVTDLNPSLGAFPNPTTPDGSWLQLANGSDGSSPGDMDFVGTDNGPGLRTGIQALTDIEQISIVAVPGKTSQIIQDELIAHCENLRYRFAVLDPPVNSSIQKVQDFRNNYDTKYAALYYPWVVSVDPLDATGNTPITLPPSGAVIGIYARTDVERGVYKAPANEVILNITSLEQVINKGEQDILNPEPVCINALRDFRSHGRGLRVWGARCITSDSSWKYVNVRRLFIFLEASLDVGLQWVVFEPNDERLWARVKQSIGAFLTRVWRDGALMGTKAEEAFFVKCDRSTMTQDDIDNGRLIVLVGVAPVKPAEFVIIRIGQWAGGSSVQEL